MGGKGRQTFEFKVSLVYRASSQGYIETKRSRKKEEEEEDSKASTSGAPPSKTQCD